MAHSTTTPTTPGSYVLAFHTAFGAPVAEGAPTLTFDRAGLRHDLIAEEYEEFVDAFYAGDLVGVADALADLTYVIYGFALEAGIPLDDVLREVHESNMSKLREDGTPLLRYDGKILKGPNYFKPDIAGVLERHGHVEAGA